MPPARSPVPPCNLLSSIKRKGRKGNRSAMGNSFSNQAQAHILATFCFCRLVAWIHVLLSFTVSAESMIHSSLSRYLSLSVVVLLRSKGGDDSKVPPLLSPPFSTTASQSPPVKARPGSKAGSNEIQWPSHTLFDKKKSHSSPCTISRSRRECLDTAFFLQTTSLFFHHLRLHRHKVILHPLDKCHSNHT